jgi:hypothetical protein
VIGEKRDTQINWYEKVCVCFEPSPVFYYFTCLHKTKNKFILYLRKV